MLYYGGMKKFHKDHPLRIFLVSGLITIIVGALLGHFDGGA